MMDIYQTDNGLISKSSWILTIEIGFRIFRFAGTVYCGWNRQISETADSGWLSYTAFVSNVTRLLFRTTATFTCLSSCAIHFVHNNRKKKRLKSKRK